MYLKYKKTVLILISWLQRKPADLDLHCFQTLKKVGNNLSFSLLTQVANRGMNSGYKPIVDWYCLC